MSVTVPQVELKDDQASITGSDIIGMCIRTIQAVRELESQYVCISNQLSCAFPELQTKSGTTVTPMCH